ncbi:GTP cyclohydrolase II [Rhodospirillum rubrum]|uniref:GTP cyclohydrolase II n=1 Tax=Rhodospirillum rubrum TaxID=1085 RepID=UPI0019088953|nr:GTP cyclohydrolase II [Rhodospirillum rubrum]MBK1663243.1 GTP cyclohydrolase II [Rhodospirillum rubrum]MBK1676196.1 GTP cyclohydrolase II [Rhodospirillum rubrum]
MTDNAPCAPFASPAADPLADTGRLLARVDRGLAELRLGAAVTISGDDGRLMALAAESASAQTLADLAALGPSPRVVLTGRRASVLGLAPAGTTPVAVTLKDGLDVGAICRLADPCLDLDGPLPAIAAVNPITGDGSAGAAVVLAKLARLLPAAVVVALEGAAPPATGAAPLAFELAAADILRYQTAAARSLRKVSEARVPLAGAEHTRILAFRPSDGGTEHLAIIVGEPDPLQPVLTRLHSECFTGDLLGSLRCDCGDQLRGALDAIATQGSGVLLYLAQEGRGIGLVNKLRAYQLQDQGFDTLDANGQLGFDDDERIYLPAAEILRQLGISRIRLLTNNPLKVEALGRHAITVVERVPHIYEPNPYNLRYLQTKARRSGHLF